MAELTRAGVVAIVGMVVSLAPLAAAFAFMLRPKEQTLALMRPLSLATIFAGIHTLLFGVLGTLRTLPAMQPPGIALDRVAHGLAEAVAPVVVAFGFLTAAWLCVAAGLRRQV